MSGGTIGLRAGAGERATLRGRTDAVVAKLIDVQLAFPFLLFAITVIAVLGPSLRNLLVILAHQRLGDVRPGDARPRP